VAETAALVIATSRMRSILDLDLANRRITVQPGVINSWVTRAVCGEGYYYAPDPSSQVVCSIGGNVAENSGGVHCLKYGVTSNHVLELEVVLPDGSVTRLGSGLAETPELDLRGVFIGSEGTLGIATAITLRLLRTPQSVAVMLADFAAMESAGEAVRTVTAAGVLPAGMEIMDNFTINAVNDLFGFDEYPRDAAAVLLIELDGQAGEVAAALDDAYRDARLTRIRPGLARHDGPRPGLPGSALEDFEQAIETALIDGHHGLRAHCRLGVVGHRQPGLAHHGQVVGAVAHGNGLGWQDAQLAAGL
jgi:glycolate oxidase